MSLFAGLEGQFRRFRPECVPVPRTAFQPFRLPSILPPDAPIDLEIGCGVGWHPIVYARENPDRCLIAIEHTALKFARFQSRLARQGDMLGNLVALHANAISWVTHCLGTTKLDRCFFLYPNPNPKNPSQRWFRMPFFERILESLKPSGQIHLATNERFYADEAVQWAKKQWGLRVLEYKELHQELTPLHKPRTHFEKKYLERGQTCYDIVFASIAD